MLVEIGRHAIESAGAVEHARRQPEAVRARADDWGVAIEPIAVEEGEGLRPGGHRFLDPSGGKWAERSVRTQLAGGDVSAMLAAGCNFRRLLEWLDLSLAATVAALAAETDPEIQSGRPRGLLHRQHGMAVSVSQHL